MQGDIITKKLNLTFTEDEKKLIIESCKDHPCEQMGIGKAKGHFGEYLQGHFDDIDGDIIDRACVAVPLKFHIKNLTNNIEEEDYYKLPFALSGSIAVFIPSEGRDIKVESDTKFLSKNAAESTLKLLNKTDWGGTLKVITRGKTSVGLGTSTSDIVASIKAISDSFGVQLKNELIAQMAVETEMASDGIMYDHATLFITTQGRILEDYNTSYPKIEILGFNSNHSERGLNTLDIPPRKYAREEKKHLGILRDSLKKALTTKDIDLLGKIAVSSARINQRFVKKPYLEEIIQLAYDNSAAGVVISHSGTMIGVMFDPQNMPPSKKLSNIIEGLRLLGFPKIRRYISK